VIGSLPTGPCGGGDGDRFPARRLQSGGLPGGQADAGAPELGAAFLVVKVVPQVGSSALADGSRLSPWW
jgi:hypothetical protein